VRPGLHSSILWVGRASGRACGRKPKRHGHPAPLSQQREFLATLDAMSDCDQVRRLREQTLKYIRERERRIPSAGSGTIFTDRRRRTREGAA
jgi:hypothetical protein